MKGATRLAIGAVALLLAGSCRLELAVEEDSDAPAATAEPAAAERLVLSDVEWRRQLTPEQYFVLREGGDESAFTGKYWGHTETGAYHCAGCGRLLFESGAKLHTDTGWPTFAAPADPHSIRLAPGRNGDAGERLRCARCGGHLGHRVRDEVSPAVLRYRVNSAALRFVSRDEPAP